jgi:hypothetical protein
MPSITEVVTTYMSKWFGHQNTNLKNAYQDLITKWYFWDQYAPGLLSILWSVF